MVHNRGIMHAARAQGGAKRQTKSPAQIAYEEDVRRCPLYHDDTPRKTWDQLDELCRSTWQRNPTPRDFDHR